MRKANIEHRYIVQESEKFCAEIYCDYYEDLEDAVAFANDAIKINRRDHYDREVVILYVENTEDYYLKADLEDEGFNWGGWHSADDVEWTSIWDEDEDNEPKSISIDNGLTFVTPEEAMEGLSWDVIAHYMEDEAREQVHNELAPCTNLEFLNRYLEVAKYDLVIG